MWPGADGSSDPDPSPGSSSHSAHSSSPSATTATGRFPGDPGDKLYLGVSLRIDESLEDKTAAIGRAPSLTRRFYKDHQVGLMSSMATQDLAQGAVPFISVKVPGSWESVADGERDEWLKGVLSGLAAAGGPVFLALHHEPENDKSPGHSADSWKAMQRRARDRALRHAADVTVVPVLMQWTFNPESGRDVEEWLLDDFPLLGVDIYNIWSPTDPKIWSEFADLLKPVRERVPRDQAIIVPEFGTPQDPLDPQRASQWLRNAYQAATTNAVVGLAWFDSSFSDPSIGDTRLGEVGDATLRELLGRPETARLV